MRRFFAFDRDGKLVAFSFYDPVYRNGEVAGYSTSFKRRVPEADAFICSAIFQFAMDVFRKARQISSGSASPPSPISRTRSSGKAGPKHR